MDTTCSGARSLPVTTLPSNELAHELVHTWLRQYEGQELDAVHVIYNTYRSSTVYEPITACLVPPPFATFVRRDRRSGRCPISTPIRSSCTRA